MGKFLKWLSLIAALLILATAPCGAESTARPESDDMAEWTVMFYFCGSDLESRYEYATENLEDISKISYPYNLLPIYTGQYTSMKDLLRDVGRVDIVMETGGASAWHTDSLGFSVSPDALQRWQYHYFPDEDGNQPEVPFHLMDQLPLQSMSDPETLSDFIRWAAETCPAKKYALVLWGHGCAGMGLLIDEMFDGDVLRLYELKQALADGGVYFETLIIDACMMANIETAWNVKDYAHWMTASQETVPGDGTAIQDWLQALVDHPSLGGDWLARSVCDMTETKYANMEDDSSHQLLTWSVVDLTKVDRLVRAAGNLLRVLNDTMCSAPDVAKFYIKVLNLAEEYGDLLDHMYDLGSVIFDQSITSKVDTGILDEAMEALADAVTYVSRGPGRSASRGLSFCYPVGYDEDKLDIYAKNFPMPDYLAYLDCISSWSAPDWVYEQAERLPKLNDIEGFRITIEKRMSESGIPALCFGASASNVVDLRYNLYQLDEETGDLYWLGKTDSMLEVTEEGDVLWRAENPMHCLAIDNEICCAELIQNLGDKPRLYDIPVQIGTDIAILRCGETLTYTADGELRGQYKVYGVWEGYNDNSDLPNRSVEPLAMLAGRDYRPVFPMNMSENTRQVAYTFGPTRTVPRALEVSLVTVPPGTYYMCYQLIDLFMHELDLDLIEIHWDGNEISFPEGFTWEDTPQPE